MAMAFCDIELRHHKAQGTVSSCGCSTNVSRFDCDIIRSGEASEFLEHDFDSTRAAATFRRAAERGEDLAHPRTGCDPCNRASYLTVAEDVAAADDHGVLLAEQADKDHDQQQVQRHRHADR